MSRTRVTTLLVASLFVAASGAGQVGCGSSNSGSAFHQGDDGGSGADGSLGDSGLLGDSGMLFGGDGSSNSLGFQVTPSTLQTITVTAGKSTPTVPFAATYNGAPVNIGWGVDQGNIGTIPAGPSSSGAFAPSGTTGGLVNVLATYGGKTLKVPVLVKLTMTQNGYNPASPVEGGQFAEVDAGAGELSSGGGLGGVGGEGLGGPVTSTSTISALQNPRASAGRRRRRAGAHVPLSLRQDRVAARDARASAHVELGHERRRRDPRPAHERRAARSRTPARSVRPHPADTAPDASSGCPSRRTCGRWRRTRRAA